MTTIASLTGTSSPYKSHGHKSPGRSLLKAGQSLLAGVTGGSSALSGITGASGAASTGLKAIQNAIAASLQNARQNGSMTDPNQIIKNAIKQVFNSGLVTPKQAADGLSQDSGSSSKSSTADTAAAPKTFQQILQSFGVSAEQFRKDLASAIQETTTASADASNPAQTIDTGSLLNVTA